MNSFRTFFTYLWIGLLAIAFFFSNSAIAQAEDYLDLYPKAELIGSNPKAKIDIYGSPGTQQPPIGKADVGDLVRVIEQATDNSGDRWNRVQLLNATHLEGWISEESVSLQEATSEIIPANPYFQINQFYPDSSYQSSSSQGSRLPLGQGNLTTQYPRQEKIQGNNQYPSQQ